MQSEFKFISPDKVEAAWNVSRSFLWRLEKSGLIKPFYIYSRKLYRADDISRLEGLGVPLFYGIRRLR